MFIISTIFPVHVDENSWKEWRYLGLCLDITISSDCFRSHPQCGKNYIIFEHSALLRDTLHWLPAPQHILFKIALMAFDCVRGKGPGYFDDVLVPVHTVGARARLRSASHGDMVVPRSCTVRFGQRSFRLSAPSVWNDLPSKLKNSDINRQGFKSSLKSWLFEHAYS